MQFIKTLIQTIQENPILAQAHIFSYPNSYNVVCILDSNEYGLRDIVISQFKIAEKLQFAVNTDGQSFKQIYDQLMKFFERESISSDNFDTNCKSRFKVSFELTNSQLIIKFLAFIKEFVENGINERIDLIGFLVCFLLQENSTKEQLSKEINHKVPALNVPASSPTIILDVSDLTDMPSIIKQIKHKILQLQPEVQKVYLRIKGELPHSQNEAKSIYIGVGFPSENKTSPIAIKDFEVLIAESRGIDKFTYSEKIKFVDDSLIVFSRKDIEKIKNEQDKADTTDSKYFLLSEQFQHLDLSKFEIRYLGDNIGFGVFARCNLEENEEFALFSGELGSPIESRGYSLECNDIFDGCALEIDPSCYGGLGQFFNHAPPLSNKEDYPKDIYFANIEEKWINIKGYEYPILKTTQKISAGSQIFFDYDEATYWKWLSRAKHLVYFTKQNTLLTKDNFEVSLQRENLGRIDTFIKSKTLATNLSAYQSLIMMSLSPTSSKPSEEDQKSKTETVSYSSP